MALIVITNNPLVQEKLHSRCAIHFKKELQYVEILTCVRDEIHQGAVLLTHPLSGSVKPSETPYKSLILDIKKGSLHMESLELIEDALRMASRMISETGPCRWTEKILQDFQVVDYDLVRFALEHAL